MPTRFPLVSRRRLEEAERELRYAVADRDYYKERHDEEFNRHDRFRKCAYDALDELHAYNVRLRRELDALRNHVPLFGDVFNGKVL